MSIQDMFNTAVAGLASQEFERSVTENKINASPSSCLYRGPNGLKCAIGHCLKDSEIVYDGDKQEYASATNLNAAAKYTVSHNSVRELQMAHDRSRKPADMRQALIEYAVNYNLVLPDVLK